MFLKLIAGQIALFDWVSNEAGDDRQNLLKLLMLMLLNMITQGWAKENKFSYSSVWICLGK